jgi:hypothetical protein
MSADENGANRDTVALVTLSKRIRQARLLVDNPAPEAYAAVQQQP